MRAPDNNKLAAIKITVYSLGFLLIGGVVLLSVLIYQRNKNHTVTVNKPEAPVSCTNAPVTIPTRAPIDKIIKDSTTLILLTHEAEDETQQIIIIDLCTGKVLHTMNMVR